MMPTFGHAPHIRKQTAKLIIASFVINIRLEVSCKFIKPQNDPTPYEHVIKAFMLLWIKCYPHS